MRIPSVVRYTAINFLKCLLFITVMCALASVVIGLMWLSEQHLGHPAWGGGSIFVFAALFFSYLQARHDVKIEDIRNSRIADRLSRDD